MHPELGNLFCRGLGDRPCGGQGDGLPLPLAFGRWGPPMAWAGAAPPAPMDDNEPVDVGDNVDVGDEAVAAVAQVTVDVPDTTTSDETIAAVVQAEEDKKAAELGKRTLSQAELRKPESNMFLTRQSRSKNSAGVAPMIRENIKRGLQGKTMLSVTIYYGIKPGSKPTKADILAVNQHIKEHMDAARALGGKDKTLDSTYSEVQGMTSTAPMSVQSSQTSRQPMPASPRRQLSECPWACFRKHRSFVCVSCAVVWWCVVWWRVSWCVQRRCLACVAVAEEVLACCPTMQ